MGSFGIWLHESDESAECVARELTRMVGLLTISLLDAAEEKWWPDESLVYGSMLREMAKLADGPFFHPDFPEYWSAIIAGIFSTHGWKGDEIKIAPVVELFDSFHVIRDEFDYDADGYKSIEEMIQYWRSI